MKHGSAYTAANPRRDSLYQSSLIAAKTVTLIGLGGGGEIALQLLRSGVEKFHFIDFDILDWPSSPMMRRVGVNIAFGSGKNSSRRSVPSSDFPPVKRPNAAFQRRAMTRDEKDRPQTFVGAVLDAMEG